MNKNSRIQDQAQHTCTFHNQKRHEKVAKLRYLCFDNYPDNRVKSNMMFSNTCTGNLETKSKWPIIFFAENDMGVFDIGIFLLIFH